MLSILGKAIVTGRCSSDTTGDNEGLQLLLRLSEQVARIEDRLERLVRCTAPEVADTDRSVFRFDHDNQQGLGVEGRPGFSRATRPPLPDPRLIRQIIRQRQARYRYFASGLFADPVWDMLLDLTAARAEHKRVSVTSLCIASGVPPTTALRWISHMTDAGLLQRVEDDLDRRRVFVTLTDNAADGMARFFADLSTDIIGLL